MRTPEQNNANPINDKVDPNKKPEAIQSHEVRPQTLPTVKKRSGIKIVGDYFEDKFGRA